MDQEIIDKAVQLAVSFTERGHKIKRVLWSPPTKATDKPTGFFMLIYDVIESEE